MGLIRTHPPHCTTMILKLASLNKSMNSFWFWTKSTKVSEHLAHLTELPLTCLMSNLVGVPAATSRSLPSGLRVIILRSLFNTHSSKLAKERIMTAFTCSQCREHDRSGRCSGQRQCREQGRSRLRKSLPTSSKAKFHDNSSLEVQSSSLTICTYEGRAEVSFCCLASSTFQGHSRCIFTCHLRAISEYSYTFTFPPPVPEASSEPTAIIGLKIRVCVSGCMIKGRKHTYAVSTMRDSMKCRNKVAWRVSRPYEQDQE